MANVKGSGLHGYERSIADVLQWQNLSADEKSLARELFVLAGRESLENDNLASAEQFLLRAQHLSPSPDVAKILAALEERKGDEAHVKGDFNQAVASYQRAVAHDPGNQTSAQKLAQLVSLRTQERQQKRQEVRRKIAQGTGLALIAVVLIGIGFFSYHKGREWLQGAAPQQKEVVVAIDSSSLSQKEPPSPPPAKTENNPPPADRVSEL